MWVLEVIFWLLLSMCGSVGGRQRGERGCAVITVRVTHVASTFFVLGPENAILVFPQCFAELRAWMRKR